MKIIWAPEAADDLEAAVTYLAERNPAAAANLARGVFALIPIIYFVHGVSDRS